MNPILFVLTLFAFQAAPNPAVDNQRVQVREITGAADAVPYDSVWIARSGQAAIFTKGTRPNADGPGILIGIKDFSPAPLVNKSGFPIAMPRPESVKLLENARVIVWDYTWKPGVATPMHFHDKDVVIFYMDEGALQSTTPGGEVTVNEYKPGMIRFNLRDRTHTETLIRGNQRAIIAELK